MQFGIFYEHQLPRPWQEDSEARLIRETLAQVELADRLASWSRRMIDLAAQLGLGALTFAFVDVSEAKHWVADYYDTFKRECTPLGQAVNPNIAMVTGFSCHDDPAEAERRGLQGFQFF